MDIAEADLRVFRVEHPDEAAKRRGAAHRPLAHRRDGTVDCTPYTVCGNHRQFPRHRVRAGIGEEQPAQGIGPVGERVLIIDQNTEIIAADAHRNNTQKRIHRVETGRGAAHDKLGVPCRERAHQAFYLVYGESGQHGRLHTPVVRPVLHAKNEVGSAGDLCHFQAVGGLEHVLPLQYLAYVLAARDENETAEFEYGMKSPQQAERPARVLQNVAGEFRAPALRTNPLDIERRHVGHRPLSALRLAHSVEILCRRHCVPLGRQRPTRECAERV